MASLVSITCSAFFVGWTGSPSGCAQEIIEDPKEVSTWIDAIETGLNNRLAQLTCKIRYEVWQGEATTREDALNGRFAEPLVLIEEGLYVKDKRLMRLQATIYNSRSRRLSDIKGDTVYLETSEHARDFGALSLYWRTDNNHYPSDLARWSGKTVPSELDPGIVGHDFCTYMWLPLCGETNRRNPVSWLKAITSESTTKLLERKVIRNVTTVSLYWKFVDSQFEVTDTFSYDISKSLPLPTYSLIRASPTDAGYRQGLCSGESEYFYQDYVRVAKGYLPKQVILLDDPPRNRPTSYRSLILWKMVEPSSRPPADEDFDVRLPTDKHQFTCLKAERLPPDVDGYRTYNLTRIRLSDLEPRCGGTPGTARARRHHGTSVAVNSLLGVLIAGLAAWWIWRRIRS